MSHIKTLPIQEIVCPTKLYSNVSASVEIAIANN